MQQKTPRERMMTPSSPSPTWLAQVGERDRRGKGHLLYLAAVLVLLTLALGGCSGGQSDQLQGRWDLDGTTIYAFDGKGGGAMEVTGSKYEFHYQIQDTTVSIDFDQPQALDRTYTFNVHENTLTLVWEESADTVTYQLQKLEDSGQLS